jgi:hypothetical protein
MRQPPDRRADCSAPLEFVRTDRVRLEKPLARTDFEEQQLDTFQSKPIPQPDQIPRERYTSHTNSVKW